MVVLILALFVYFLFLFSIFILSTSGLNSPYPATFIRLGSMPFSIIILETAIALATDNSQFEGNSSLAMGILSV